MENKDTKIESFNAWDWFFLVLSAVLIVFGISILLITKSQDGIGPLFWGFVMGYFKIKKYKKLGLTKDINK